MRAAPQNIRMIAQDLDHPEGLNFGPDGTHVGAFEAGLKAQPLNYPSC